MQPINFSQFDMPGAGKMAHERGCSERIFEELKHSHNYLIRVGFNLDFFLKLAQTKNLY